MEKILSVFVDESGDFGSYKNHSPYYLISLVFHDQDKDISDNIEGFESRLSKLNHGIHAVHTGPLVRRESIYKDDLIEERKRLFNALFNFTRKLDIKYSCIKIKKRECRDIVSMTAKISKSIAEALHANEGFWRKFDRIIIYYDNGQIELTKILTSVFNALYVNVEFRKEKPINYKLFQVADMICTVELLAEKADVGIFSASEMEFFDNIRTFRKNYLKVIRKKRL